MGITATATVEPRSWRTGGGRGGSSGGWGGDGGGRFHGGPHAAQTYRLGMLFALASISMLFIGLTSAYAVRQGLDPGWRGIRLPALLLVNTVILLASSFTLEKGRRAGNANALIRWLGSTVLLGSLFLIGQMAAWRQLSDQGVYLGTNPHGAFFYLLTCLHGLHLLGGLLALSYLSLRVRLDHGSLLAADTGRRQAIMRVERRTRMVDVTAMYWHFMDGLWVYLLLLLFVWR